MTAAPKPPTVKLNKTKRQKLLDAVMLATTCTAEQAAETAAFDAVADALRAAYNDFCPPEDLEVLRRYGCASMYPTVYIVAPGEPRGPDGKLQSRCHGVRANTFEGGGFCLCPRDVIALERRRQRSARSYAYGCHYDEDDVPADHCIEAPARQARLPQAVREALWPLYAAWGEAVAAHDAAREEHRAAMRAIIWGASTLEEVIAVWPAAERFREPFGGTAAVTDELKARARARMEAS